MNVKKYENKMKYPEKLYMPRLNKNATPNEIRTYADRKEVYEKELKKFKKARLDYRTKDQELFEQFKIDALKEVGLDKHKNAKKIFEYACQDFDEDQNHDGGGYAIVFNILKELADIIL